MESSRKFLMAGALAAFVIGGFFISTQVGAQVCPLAIGMPYRTPEVSTVYVITEGCEKRPVFNPDVYFSHFSSFSVVKFVSASTLAAVPNSPLQFLPWGPRRTYENGALLKIVTDPKVYLLLDGKLYPITDEPMFLALGFKFSQVLDVTTDVMAKFVKQSTPPPTVHVGHAPTGGPFIDVSAIPEGKPGTDQLRIVTAPFPRRVADGVGAFRTQCQMSHMNFDDPLVFPGQVGASHLHAFFGNATIDAFLQPGHLRDIGTKSTCGGGIANLSGYWVPALIDATGVPLVPTNNIVYYKSGYGGVEPEDIKEFPVGLRMIAGNAKSSAAQEYAYWECLNGGSNTHYPSIPPSCPDGSTEIQMSIMFPQCWDGVNLDSSDHKSHMAYPRRGCPSTHPVAIPAISYNIRYAIPPEGLSGLRLASDMYSTDLPGGFSSHGDWWDGWDHETVKKWMTNCVNAGLDCGGGLISDTEYLAHD